MKRHQDLNLPLSTPRWARSTSGGATGSTNNVVLLFVGSTYSTNGVIAIDDAVNGTAVSIVAPGKYAVSFGFIAVNGDVTFAVSVDQTTNLANADPSFAVPGVVAVLAANGVAAGVNQPCTISTTITIDRATAYGPSGAIVRFIASDSNDGPPGAVIVAGSAWYTVEQVAETFY